MDSSSSKTVCVTGAAGFIGSWLVMRLLERGYTVRATVRDPGNTERVKHLLELPNAETNLSLWKADLSIEGSFDEAIKGCVGVFHVASPMDFEAKDPENEVIKPAINGVLDILKACVKAKSVKRIILTSSAATINWNDKPKSFYDETSWSDIDFCRRVKMTGWMYFVSKTEAEQEAWKFSKEHNLDLISIIPTVTLGPFLASSMPPSITTALSLITGNEAHYSILKQCQYVHIDDVCLAHIFLYENPEAQGRYICSSHDANIHDIANFINDRYPHHYNVPTKFKNIPDQLETITFSSKKLKDLGFQFKYSLDDMFDEAIETCLEKGLLPNPDVEDH